MNVFDSSALLAFVQGERGAEVVEAALDEGGVCSAANWSEVAQKCLKQGTWDRFRGVLLSYPLAVGPVTQPEAERAALLWQAHPTFSLADRLCLASGESLGATILTADKNWAGQPGVVLIR